MAALGRAIRVVQSPAALALTVLIALTHPVAAQPTVGAVDVAGIMLCTNTEMTCTVTSSSSTITNISLSYGTKSINGGSVNSVTTNVNKYTTGLNTATATFSYPLVPNVIYTGLTVTALDDTGASGATNGLVANAPEVLDTLQPTLVIEAEDYNYTNGGYMNTPPDGGLALYQGLVGIPQIDYQWQNSTGPANYYRPTDATGGNGPQCETTGDDVGLMPQKFWTALANGDSTDVPVEIGYNSGGNWFDYTRDFGSAPTNSATNGTYNIYVFLSDDDTSDPSIELSTVTSSTTTSNQTQSAVIGVFNLTDADWNNYFYVPMTDKYGTLASVTLSGHETLRCTVVGQANIDFFMLVPAVPVLTPILEHSFPDGNETFQSTNSFNFTVGAANGAGIPQTGITLILNGQNVTSGVNFTGGTNAWTGSIPIYSNMLYTATLNVVNASGLSSSFAFTFDTFNINNFQFEANDYDFSTNNGTTWISGLFIDNPIPSADTTANLTGHLTNTSFFDYPADGIPSSLNASNGASAQQGIDVYFQTVTGEQVAYRNDLMGSQPATDYVRPKFVAAQSHFSDPNIGLFNIGWTSTGDWENYTRTYPAGKFTIWGRLSGNSAWSGSQMAIVTGGLGTANQTSNVLGSFADPNAAGWQTYHWIPCVDAGGTPVSVTLGGKATLKFICGGGINEEFYMLVPFEPSTVPTFVSSYPDGVRPFEITNVYTFEVSSASGAAITSSGIGLTLNGVSVNGELTIANSSTNWSVSVPILENTLYSAVISVTNSGGQYSTFYKTFDTFNVTNYQWEANDYDYNSGMFIDLPVPTCEVTTAGTGSEETNSYFGFPGGISGNEAVSNVDYYDQSPQVAANAGNDWYRADGQGSGPTGDFLRPKFIAEQTALGDNNIGPFQLGYTSTGDWQNYTRHYPAGNFNIYGRIAGNSAWKGTEIAIVTGGFGTMNQTSNVLGSFADPNANGWESFHWVPLLQTNGAMSVVSLGGKATLKAICGGGVNEAYYMLVPAAAQTTGGTGPTLGASIVGGLLNIAIPTATGHNYQVVYSGVLSTNQASWSAVGAAIVGDGTTHVVTEPVSGTQGYYEIKVQ